MQIKKITQERPIAQCFQIGKKLPDHFNDEGFKKMEEDLRIHDLYVIGENDQLLGFITINIKNDYLAEISWLAIDPEYQNKGYGTQLLNSVTNDLKNCEIKLLEVKTLDSSSNYEPYLKTIQYYLKNGFIHIETIHPYPGWGEENPCAIYIKIL